MRILLHECIDQRLRFLSGGHDFQPAEYAKLSGLKNGVLLAAAELAGFQIRITTYQEIPYRQNLAVRRIPYSDTVRYHQPPRSPLPNLPLLRTKKLNRLEIRYLPLPLLHRQRKRQIRSSTIAEAILLVSHRQRPVNLDLRRRLCIIFARDLNFICQLVCACQRAKVVTQLFITREIFVKRSHRVGGISRSQGCRHIANLPVYVLVPLRMQNANR